MLDNLSHELYDELEGGSIELWQLLNQGFQLVDPPLWCYLRQVHVSIILVKRAYRALHLTHELFPVVAHDVTVCDGLQIVEVFLTHVNLQLTDISLWSGDSEQAFSSEMLWVLPEIASKEPKYQRYSLAFDLLERPQMFSKNV